jgi:NADP-dependent 3-hydroxy acid dehydrogenase YdfG
MDKRIALITGCSTGIGRDLAERMTAAGYTVVATARRVETLQSLPTALKLSMDVTNEESVRRAISEVMKSLGRIDVLVNNAGFAATGMVEELPEAALRSMFEVNLFGATRVLRAVAPIMRAQGSGTIINISSIAGKFSLPTNGGYSATKFALEAISDAARPELKPFGIRVILVEPGSVRSRFDETVRAGSQARLNDPDSPYAELYRQSEAMSDGMRKTQAKPEAVSRVILEALRARNPKPRYLAAAPGGIRLMLHLSDRLRDRLFETARKSAKA